MPSYEFIGQMNYKLTDSEPGVPLPKEDQAEITVLINGYPGKLVNAVPYTEGPIVLQVIQDGVLFGLEPDSDGILQWVEEEE